MESKSLNFFDVHDLTLIYILRCTSGSLEHLKVESELSSPRYTTRSTKKLSKSMNDLLMA